MFNCNYTIKWDSEKNLQHTKYISMFGLKKIYLSLYLFLKLRYELDNNMSEAIYWVIFCKNLNISKQATLPYQVKIYRLYMCVYVNVYTVWICIINISS